VCAAAMAASAETVVDVTGVGEKEKTSVSINVTGQGAAAYAATLKRNLELTGCFVVRGDGAVKVTGTVGGSVTARGAGKIVTAPAPATDDKSARMAARRMSDAMCEAMSKNGQKGFACDRVIFVSRKTPRSSELCMCYPDGQDVRELTRDGKAAVGPRWKDANTVYYIGYLNGGQQIFEHNVETGARRVAFNLKGISSPAAVSPDGTKVAIAASFQGNPELYVLSGGRYTRLTNTKTASEGQPTWSPDGTKIAYVSDETRHPQIYVIDVATKEKRRVTAKGTQNVDPDWGADGRLTYITKRGGLSQVAVMDPKVGDSSAKLVTSPGSWEHPAWARDGRHVVAGRDKALFVVDTVEKADGGDEPRQMFKANGNWITPTLMR
jgi:tol-pal system beta propeller repeat protein TolB